ncbi:MAG: helix-turn-helix transcriptional regulator [Gemmatimonadaceae bacterium]|nr:helix-turn-helix transcriptional regulator [Gemmatimonadaceae bacterium]
MTDFSLADGTPELTILGKRLEILRIERGVSKQRLARHAGTSRQQLWRVMTGKSELTTSLRERLATALAVEPHAITTTAGGSTRSVSLAGSVLPALQVIPTIHDYLSDASGLATTLRTLPSGDGGRRLKRALLNSLEDLAVEAGQPLPLDYSEIRRRVLAGEL